MVTGHWRKKAVEPGHFRGLFAFSIKLFPDGNLIELSDGKKGTSRFTYDPVEMLREAPQPERGLSDLSMN